jgi:hypothetical protein
MTYINLSRARASSFLVIAVVMAGCEHADPLDDERAAPTFASIQQTIFTLNCAVSGCHLGGSAAAQLDLSAGNAYSNLVGVASVEVPTLQRVEPGDPDNSYLVRKVEGGPGITGVQMPRGRDPLSAEQIQAIRDWIAAGAKNN